MIYLLVQRYELKSILLINDIIWFHWYQTFFTTCMCIYITLCDLLLIDQLFQLVNIQTTPAYCTVTMKCIDHSYGNALITKDMRLDTEPVYWKYIIEGFFHEQLCKITPIFTSCECWNFILRRTYSIICLPSTNSFSGWFSHIISIIHSWSYFKFNLFIF